MATTQVGVLMPRPGLIYDSAKCGLCGKVIHIFGNVMWCDDCMDEFFVSKMSMDDFIAKKRKENNLD